MELLNVIDEKGNIVGEDTRANVHKLGLLHKEIYVWFYTPDGKIIFQQRSLNKDVYPGLLAPTVGGHVKSGHDFLDTALREVGEETGIPITVEDIKPVKIYVSKTFDELTGNTNYALKAVYIYYFKGQLKDLKIEPGEALAYDAIPLEDLSDVLHQDGSRFTPSIPKPETLDVFEAIRQQMAQEGQVS